MKLGLTTYVLWVSVLAIIPNPVSAQWDVQTTVDEFTGERSRYATARGTGGEYRPGWNSPPYLGLQCDERGALLYLQTPGTFLSSGGDHVSGLLKVDTRETIEIPFRANAEGTGVYIRGAEALDHFWKAVADLRAGRTAKIRLRDYRGVAYDYTFPLAGVTRATDVLGCWDINAIRARRAAAAVAEKRRQEAAEATADSLAEVLEQRGRTVDSEQLPTLEVGDTIKVCNLVDPGAQVEGRIGNPDNVQTYAVPFSGECDARRTAHGEIRRFGEDEQGAPWVFVKLFSPFYHAWIQPRHLYRKEAEQWR